MLFELNSWTMPLYLVPGPSHPLPNPHTKLAVQSVTQKVLPPKMAFQRAILQRVPEQGALVAHFGQCNVPVLVHYTIWPTVLFDIATPLLVNRRQNDQHYASSNDGQADEPDRDSIASCIAWLLRGKIDVGSNEPTGVSQCCHIQLVLR